MDVGSEVLIGEEKAVEDGMNPGIDCPRWESDRSSAWCGVLETANYIEYIGFGTTHFRSTSSSQMSADSIFQCIYFPSKYIHYTVVSFVYLQSHNQTLEQRAS